MAQITEIDDLQKSLNGTNLENAPFVTNSRKYNGITL